MAGYTFICYAHENTRFVFKLARQLQRRGVSVWLDQWNAVHHDAWDRDVTRAINGCSQILVVLSPAAVNSWVVYEQVLWALQSGKRVILVLREPCEVPPVLSGRPCVNFVGRNFRTALGQLLTHYYPGQELRLGYWSDVKAAWGRFQGDLVRIWHHTLLPLLWPGWLGPTLIIGLFFFAGVFFFTRAGRESFAPRPTLESLSVVQPTSTPTPEPTHIKTRVRSKDGQLMFEVPAGQFLMGSVDSDLTAKDDEKPQHLVYVDTFWIDATEITNGQFEQCVDAGDCTPAQARNRIFRDEPLPVVGVSWEQASRYCKWVGARLPTEAEWEKAARGTDGRLYPWGNEFDGRRLNYCDTNCVADWRDRSANDGHRYTAPAGSYPHGASPYGVLDMSGNVWEWTADWYAPDAYVSSPLENPTGPASGLQKVIRGGSWYYIGPSLRVARRHKDVPTSSYDNIGFRCVVDEAEQAQR